MNSLVQQAELAHRQGDLETAQQLYRQQLSVDAQHVDALYGLGTLLMQTEQFDAAESFFSKALALEPDAADIGYNYAICMRNKGDSLAATKLATHAADCAGQDEEFSINVCSLLISLNEPQLALSQLARFPHNSQASYLIRAEAFGLLGAWDQAVALLRQLQQADKNSSQVAQALAIAAGRLRDYNLAISAYSQYLQLITPGITEYVKFADLFLLARKIDQCEIYLGYAKDAGAETAEFHLLQAKLARLKGEYSRAVSSAEAAVAQNSSNAEAWSVLLEIAQIDELPSLVKRIEESLESGDWTVYETQLISYVLADAHARLENNETAFTHYSRANAAQNSHMKALNNRYDSAASDLACESILQQFPSYVRPNFESSGHATPLFIVGMPRSGTTLVERMLAQLPNVEAGGENEALGFLVSQYQKDVAAGRVVSPDRLTHQDWQTLAARYFDTTPLFKEREGGVASGQFITDKMPHNFQHVGMILSLFPDAKVIQMRRDPRDVCWSIFTRMFSESHNYACDFDSLAHAYANARRLMDHWVALAPERVMDVNYESLVANPRETGQRITAFCGLPWNDDCLNFHKTVSSSFTFSELQVRETISDKRIGRWQPFEAYLSPLFDALKRAGCID